MIVRPHVSGCFREVKTMMRRFFVFVFVLVVQTQSTVAFGFQEPQSRSADVVVYGATSAGVMTAVQLDRDGHSVILVAPSGHVGGLTTSGLGWTDSGRKDVIGGLARDFYERIKQHYDQPEAWKFEEAKQYSRYRPDESAMWTFEPSVAQSVMGSFLDESQVELLTNERLDRSKSPVAENGTINSIRMESGMTLSASYFVDATYEGDLMAAAGVSYTVGREPNATYNETLNGNQVGENIKSHRFLKPVSPYVIAGDAISGLLPGIDESGPGSRGTGDDRLQAFCFRMCMSRVAENQVPFEKPADYDEGLYELLLRNFEAGDERLPLKPDMMPNGKTDTNNNCAVSTDFIGFNYSYPEASYDERAQIIAKHLSYQQGLMWTLANHPRVPQSIRDQMGQWGLAKDEFRETNHWPPMIYVRESRRMVSDYVMTEHDCRRNRICDDPIGMGSYNMDSHNVRRFVTEEGFVQNEGDVQVSPGGPYLISYRSILPAKGECENLVVPVCISSSHIAFGSIRMEPVFMILGQSAAVAIDESIQQRCSLREIDYDTYSQKLKAAGQVIELPTK
ncbi:MAG: FAD-dependent oxidoreductase [Pirellulaceae bacterium]